MTQIAEVKKQIVVDIFFYIPDFHRNTGHIPAILATDLIVWMIFCEIVTKIG
jgi:hypothetical protein